ncbi:MULTISPECIES: M1 family metallopeptidase [Nocardioides]|uniref:Aminopeptidase N n=1 Tax=Nocardioides vastitatis TaxID=2568655 RepID=A0ABW0ZQB7_9ACTN|nr:M1 family metallopeptidase [Nocardioides sp.]
MLLLVVLAPGLPLATAEDSGPGSPSGGDGYWPLDGNSGTDARHYDIRVAYDFADRILAGRTKIRMRATKDLSSFSLDLVLPVSSVSVDGRRARFRRPHPHEVRVVPSRAIAAGDLFTVEVRYRGRPERFAYAGQRNWLADRHEVVTMNEPHMAPWWYPSNDHPSDKATFDIRVNVPRAKEVVSNGVRVSRRVSGNRATTHWRMTDPMTTYLAFFAAGDFRIETGRTRSGIRYYNAVSDRLPASVRSRAVRILRRTSGITEWLQRQLGDYPFSTTGGLVTSLPVGFALENQTRPTYGSWIYPGVVVHEVAHQWFGDSVSVRRWRDIWLNEGFATYAEVFYAAGHGGPSVNTWLQGVYDATCRHPGSVFWRLDLDDPGASRVFHSAVYDRGAMVLAALRNRIGGTDLLRLLRTWVRDHRDGNATVAQFETLAETVSGEQLDGFFDAWLRSGAPPAGTSANGLGRGCP